ncbi:GNAT family N-acetyltransferase [Halobacterium salinarum]|uniref:GNAT family N-acetyltransferase n=1 Tax=Halobacterium salinarum TaxID=2242 RepID=UPI0025565E85|nr:GNAT family N-acetyltransferase [Halobacterium salinarum]MDL0131631.1 GNAT family N-acetyltransferase [Halobacterium salinarum]
MPDDYVVRPFLEEDEEEFLDLHANVFGDKPAEWFNWKYSENPYIDHVPILTVEEVQTGRCVGFRPHLALKLRKGSWRGVGLQPCDTIVHPDHRRQGLFTKMTQAAICKYKDEDIGFFFNFPNEQSRPGYLKLGWEVVGEMQTETRIRSPSAWGKASPNRFLELAGTVANPLMRGFLNLVDFQFSFSNTGSTIRKYEKPPAQLLSSISKTGTADKFNLHRTKDFYEWRYSRPDIEYSFYIANRDGESKAALITAEIGSVLMPTTAIVEAVEHQDGSCEDQDWFELMRAVIENSDSKAIQMFAGDIPRHITRRLGFFSSSSFPLSRLQNPPQLVAYPLSTDGNSLNNEKVLELQEWDLSWSAWDVV